MFDSSDSLVPEYSRMQPFCSSTETLQNEMEPLY
jgi:hypothetical protein